MPIRFTAGSNSLNQSNIDTNNVCPCSMPNNKKIINSSNNTVIQNFTRVQKQVNLINYSSGGKTMFGNNNPYLTNSIANMNNAYYVGNNRNVLNVNAVNNDNTPITNQYIRCNFIDPFVKKCVRPIKNKF
jgi:hypothetical protein